MMLKQIVQELHEIYCKYIFHTFIWQLNNAVVASSDRQTIMHTCILTFVFSTPLRPQTDFICLYTRLNALVRPYVPPFRRPHPFCCSSLTYCARPKLWSAFKMAFHVKSYSYYKSDLTAFNAGIAHIWIRRCINHICAYIDALIDQQICRVTVEHGS